jgi:cellulose synthase (UDP-forming)
MSNSRHVHNRFRERVVRRHLIAGLYIGTSLIYLAWRATILNADTPGLSLVYFVAECLGFILGLTLIFSSWTYRHRDPLPAAPGLTVDVFVTTYKEPLEVIRWTLIAAKEISYPHRTFVLDDGDRADIKALATDLGLRYLARGHNAGAKAGNLNYGLSHSDAEFVMTFDADHIAQPHALDVTLGFFRDPTVALVQTPEDFYNTDAFQFYNAKRAGGLWNDQSFFYSFSQPCRDALNAASCVGTGVVYRRAAIDAVGGMPEATVTEDMHCSLKLHKAGWSTVFLNEPISYGIAAADNREFYKTRHRWGHGNIHALRVENILFCRGLTLRQRLSYLTLGLVHLEGWQQFLLFVVPWMSLFFGWAPFEITVFNVLMVLCFPILATLLLQELGCGLSRYWVNEIYAVARFPIQIVTALALFRDRILFRSSSKNIRGRVEWPLLLPQIAVLAVSLAALATGVIGLARDFRIGPLADAFVSIAAGDFANVAWNARLDQGYTLELVAVAGFWALFNAAKSAWLVRKAVNDARRSVEHYRFEACFPIEIDMPSGRVPARIERISSSWFSAHLYAGEMPEVGERLTGQLYLPSGTLAVECMVTRRGPDDWVAFRSGRLSVSIAARPADVGRIECEFIARNVRSRETLMRSLYSVDWQREFLHREAYFSTPLDVIARLLTLQAPFPARARWSPVLLHCGPFPDKTFGLLGAGKGGSAELLAFIPLSPGQVVDVLVLEPSKTELRIVRIGAAQPLRSLGSQGLDRASIGRYSVQAVDAEVKRLPVLTKIAAAE